MKIRVLGFGLLLVSCTCSEPEKGWVPPPVEQISSATPPVPAPPPVAPSASAAPAVFEHIDWEVPPSWTNLGVPVQGLQRAHFRALAEPHEGKVPDQVQVFVIRRAGAVGKDPDTRAHDALLHEVDAFTKVDFKKEDHRIVDGRKVPVIEIHGTMREMVPQPPDGDPVLTERPKWTEITAILPAKTLPYRVAVHGREDLVDRVREDFFRFVDSLRLKDEASE